MKLLKKSKLAALVVAGLLLTGCGGGGSGDPDTGSDEGIVGTGMLLKGTVGSESRLVDANIQIKSSDGIRSVASVNSNGRYETENISGDLPT